MAAGARDRSAAQDGGRGVAARHRARSRRRPRQCPLLVRASEAIVFARLEVGARGGTAESRIVITDRPLFDLHKVSSTPVVVENIDLVRWRDIHFLRARSRD